jgi:hypothetical protein
MIFPFEEEKPSSGKTVKERTVDYEALSRRMAQNRDT